MMEKQMESPNPELIRALFSRPKMFSKNIESLRDFLFFLEGTCCGLRPPHGAIDLNQFGEFINKKFGKPSQTPWIFTLIEEFGGDTRIADASPRLVELYDLWLKTKE